MMVATLVFADQVMGTAGGLQVGHENPCRCMGLPEGCEPVVKGWRGYQTLNAKLKTRMPKPRSQVV